MRHKIMMRAAVLAGFFLLKLDPAQAQIKIGQLADYSGSGTEISKAFGEGEEDAIAYINETGGIDGEAVLLDSVHYAGQVTTALSGYKRWMAEGKPVAILGWGMSDTDALMPFITKDQIPYLSGSYLGALTDPVGLAERTERPAPFNLFYGPSYSDALRAMIQWAAEDWKAKGREEAPKYVHMGASHAYPSAVRLLGEDYAKQLGFAIVPLIRYAMMPADFSAPCTALKESGANYAYLGNPASSNIALLKACEALGIETQFLTNVWSIDEPTLKTVGPAGNGVLFPLRVGSLWGAEGAGMELVRKIAKQREASESYRSLHYIAGVCNVYYLKEAIEWAKQTGEITGVTVRDGFYHKQDWTPAGLEGVCPPANWTAQDHRSVADVRLYRSLVSGPTGEAALSEVMDKEVIRLRKAVTIAVPRKAEWLGW